MLKNLAKLLVDRIEAACVAQNQPQVSNPKKSLDTAPPSCSEHGLNPGRETDHGVGNSHEYGSILDVHESMSTEEAPSPFLGTQQQGDDRPRQCIQETNKNCMQSNDASPNHGSIWENSHNFRSNVSRPSSQPNPSGNTWEPLEGYKPSDFRSSSQPNPSGTTSEMFVGHDSRPSSVTRECIATTVASRSSRMLTLKKLNVGVDGCEIKPPPKVHSTAGRNLWSPGLRSLVIPQVKNLQPPPARPPANTKLIQSSSKSKQKEVNDKDESAQKEAKHSKLEELHKIVWADVVQNVFDEAFGGQAKQPSHGANTRHQSHQASRPPHNSEECVIQTQSIEYSSSTDSKDLFA